MSVESRLLGSILRRSSSLFAADLAAHRHEIRERVGGSRVLIIGAAGSIGGAFVRQIAEFSPSALHLVDLSENNLVEVVRDLRSSPVNVPEDFLTLPLALGSPELHAFLAARPSYDYVLNFAAMKHVRSEKDPFTLMRMVFTNACHLQDLLERLVAEPPRKTFSVSSDKAVNPANAMGATKTMMERVLLHFSDRLPVSSARFANVAFSDGSLLHGFHRRLEKRQPLSAPNDVRRYFISHQEAGELCLLACFLGGNRETYIPRLETEVHLLTFSEIAELFLEAHGLTADPCSSEEEARRRAADLPHDATSWPCFFFGSDTTGEKPVEEFAAFGASVDWSSYRAIGVVREEPLDGAILEDALAELRRIRAAGAWSKEQILEVIVRVVPELRHEETGRNLDQKM